MDMLVNAIFLGIVEGLTEFLPISSTGHLIILNRFFSFSDEFTKMFDIVIQLGAILSVIVAFRSRLLPFTTSSTREERAESRETWKRVLVGVLPAIVIGGLLGKRIQDTLFNPVTVAVALFIGAIGLLAIEKWHRPKVFTDVKSLTYSAVLAIGLIQCLAMVPGTSRSAATIIGAVALGASRATAVEFSFFLAVPTMVAASGYSLIKHATNVAPAEWVALAVGFIVSFFVAWAVITTFLRYVRTGNFKPFAYYRMALSLVIAVLLFLRVFDGL